MIRMGCFWQTTKHIQNYKKVFVHNYAAQTLVEGVSNKIQYLTKSKEIGTTEARKLLIVLDYVLFLFIK